MNFSTGSGGRPTGGQQTSRAFRELTVRPGLLLGRSSLALLGLALTILAQATLLSRVRLFGACPNLMLVTTVAVSLLLGMSEGLIWGFVGGLGLDLITGMPLGTSSLALMTACLLTNLGRSRVFSGSLWWPMLMITLATPLYAWIVLLTQQVRGIPVDWVATTELVVGPELLLNAISMALVYPILRGLTARPR